MTGSGSTPLQLVADRIRLWFDAAWPLWLEQGMDGGGLFHEQLDLAGRPDLSPPRRVRVQARQLYAVSRAQAAGYPAANAMLATALEAVERRCWGKAGGPGWIHLLTPAGEPSNTLRDLYDQAFVLFALAGVRQAGFEHALTLGRRTLDFIDTALADHDVGGYREGLPDSLPRRSNPHMHLLEAFLAWHAVTGESEFLDRANRIAWLFAEHFFDRTNRTLGEFFDAKFVRLPGARGDVVEPGHHFEWSWLLHRLAEAGGTDLRHEARTLHDWAVGHGLDANGFAIDESDRSGRATRSTRRVWPQTELIKSTLANGDTEAAARVAGAFLDSYLATPIEGLWVDQFDQAGAAMSSTVPASTFYHIIVAFEDLLRMAGG
ncbi:AGE family epimerase/isomerase [Lichenicola sp.]|uniref:AGE family epimerase/isomerase n=1 Tax=Lichenicola sp. TaxID=2804529 RepID=UPI003B00B0A8